MNVTPEPNIVSCKTIEDLLYYILYVDKYNNPFTINIYHIHIGSKTHIAIPTYIPINSSSINASLINSTSHNHEFTTFLKSLLYNPLNQFSPEFISNLHNYSNTNIRIRNVVILIDPMYAHSPDLEGFREVKNSSDEHIYQNCNDTFTLIKTSINIIQVPIDVNEEQIIKIIDILENISNLYSVLINIMDCTTRTLLNLYSKYNFDNNIHNTHTRIYITRPDCMISDMRAQYNPIFTINMHNYYQQGKLSVRWLNCISDALLIPELDTVLDICSASQITYTFLTESYKYNIGLELLIAIMKLWSRMYYTNETIISILPDKYDDKTILAVNFSTITFNEFIIYWKTFSLFREFLINSIDDYYKYSFKIFIDDFVYKYEACNGQFTIIEALQIEAIQIFKILINYCKKDARYIIENINCLEDNTSHLLERKQILDFLKFNNVSI